jgi:hypothetical protein
MLINLLPDFFSALQSPDPVAAYQRYFEVHRRILGAYWHNYVVDPDGPHFLDVVRTVVHAGRADLRAMLERTDVVSLARTAEEQCSTRTSMSMSYSWLELGLPTRASSWSMDAASRSRVSSTSPASRTRKRRGWVSIPS